MSPNYKKFKEGQEMVFLILYMAMFSSIGMFFALVEIGLLKPNTGEVIPIPIHYIGLIPAAISIYIHYRLKSPQSLAKGVLQQARQTTQIRDDYDEKENRMRFFYPQYMVRMILSLAMNEAVTILALVGYLGGATSLMEFYTNFGISVVLMGMMRPQTGPLYKEVEKIISRELY